MIDKHSALYCAIIMLFVIASMAKSEIVRGSDGHETNLLSSVYSICVDIPDRMTVIIYQHVDSEVVNISDDGEVLIQFIIDPYPSRKFSAIGVDGSGGVLKNNELRLSLLAMIYSEYLDAYYSFSPLIRKEARGDRVFLRAAYSIEECGKCDATLEKIVASMRYCSEVVGEIKGEIKIGASPSLFPPFRSIPRNLKLKSTYGDENRNP